MGELAALAAIIEAVGLAYTKAREMYVVAKAKADPSDPEMAAGDAAVDATHAKVQAVMMD